MANQTGPRTTVGKINSSRNALKKGIYTNAVLAGEDIQALEELALDISESYCVNDAAGEILVRRFLQHTLQTNRLQSAQTAMIEAKMHSHACRQDFCNEVNLQPIDASLIPSWYFESDVVRKATAKSIYLGYQEAEWLMKNHSPEMMLQAKTKLPKLWLMIMGETGSATQKVYATLGERMASLYGQAHPKSNIQLFMESLEQKHRFDLLWGENEDRYKAVIAGLRAKAVLDVLSDPNWSRAEGALHRRSQDLLGSLVALKRENANPANLQFAICNSNRCTWAQSVKQSHTVYRCRK